MKNSNTTPSTAPFASTPDKATVTPPTTLIENDTVGEAVGPRMLGYVRVSTREQNEDRQVIAMREFGVPEEHILVEKQSGKDFNRPIYLSLVASLRPGDILVVKSIDRLGRNYEEIIEQWRILTKEKKAAIVVIDMPLLDTRKEHDLTGTLVADLVLQLLSYVAETERRFIKQRQAEGIAAARARGVHLGRPVLPVPDGFEQTVKEWEAGKVSLAEAQKRLGMTETTFYRRRREYRLLHPLKKESS